MKISPEQKKEERTFVIVWSIVLFGGIILLPVIIPFNIIKNLFYEIKNTFEDEVQSKRQKNGR